LFLVSTSGAARLWSVAADGTALGFFASDTGLLVDAFKPSPLVDRLLVSVRPGAVPPAELWEMDSFGGFLRRITVLEQGSYGVYAWSPDGRYLTYCIPTPASPADLVLLHVESGEQRALTTGAGFECEPVWVP
jgi:tricorn protease-like protein